MTSDLTLLAARFVPSKTFPSRFLYPVAGKGNLGIRADTGEVFYSNDDGGSQAFYWSGGNSASLDFGKEWPARSLYVFTGPL